MESSHSPQSRGDIVIKAADKGGVGVVWASPKKLYIQESNLQLKDANFYFTQTDNLIISNNMVVKKRGQRPYSERRFTQESDQPMDLQQ